MISFWESGASGFCLAVNTAVTGELQRKKAATRLSPSKWLTFTQTCLGGKIKQVGRTLDVQC